MATLVLSTVGTVLGGPVGSAIGALVGQSIDQQLLAPARRGPRLGDLNVQTSTYGTQIPRIYGRMRVAGSVVWSTDLIEHAETGGAKGQPDVSYSYTVSFAVALSSRRAKSIGRIWADGKLLRGAAGDFKVPVTFRFMDGSEDQPVDPLIASIEGIAGTPAYRGLALAVFEDLDLREFGNRIPFLTFEVCGDDAAPTVGYILSDASEGAISSDANQQLVGFAAYGSSVRSAVEPLVDMLGIHLFDDGIALRQPRSDVPEFLDKEEFSNSVERDQAPLIEREQVAAQALPSVLRLSYYDVARDYQTGETRAAASERRGKEAHEELAGVLGAGEAKALAQAALARAWAERDKLTLRLPPKRLGLEPGSVARLSLEPGQWFVESARTEAFATVAELRPCATRVQPVPADPGRVVSDTDVVDGPLTLALLDFRNLFGSASNEATVFLAGTRPTARWRRQSVRISCAGFAINAETAVAKSKLGYAVDALAPSPAYLIDEENSVEVQLIDVEQWLTSCSDEALASGENLAVVGRELFQFGRVAALGGGRFRLSRLLRGRGGSEWACSNHVPGEFFCLVEPSSLRPVAIPTSCIGGTISAEAADGSAAFVEFQAEGLRPLSPVHVRASAQPDGSLTLSWVRRSRAGFAWLDGVEVPVGETIEQYRVAAKGSSGTVEITTSEQRAVLATADIASLGPGLATIEVRQVGDYAVSRPAQLAVDLV